MVQHREGLFCNQCVPSHIDIHGNEKADKLAEEVRRRHQAYSVEWAWEVGEQLSRVGLQEMLDEEIPDLSSPPRAGSGFGGEVSAQLFLRQSVITGLSVHQ